MFGVSVPYKYLRDGRDIFGEFPFEKGSPCPLAAYLVSLGAGSAELRQVGPSEDPADVLRAARILWNAGLAVTVHGKVKSLKSAVSDVFDPISLLIENLPYEIQKRVNVTIHPIAAPDCDFLSENVKMLTDLVRHVIENDLPVSIALENKRLMPDDSFGDCCPLVRDAVEAVRDAFDLPDPDLCRSDKNPVVGICFDMGHYAWYKKTSDPDAPYCPPDEKFMKYVIHTHIHGLSGANKTHFPIVTGSELPFVENLRAFERSYAGILNLELEPKRFWEKITFSEAIRKTLERLRQSLTLTYQMFDDLRKNFADRLYSSLSLLDESAAGARFSLPQSTFYVFNTNGTKWVADPSVRAAGKITGMTEKLPGLLKKADYIFISHAHSDHFDKDVVRLSAGKGPKWIIPDFMVDKALSLGLSENEIVTSRANEPLSLGNLTVYPFKGRHFRPVSGKGVPCMGYKITSEGAPSILLVGDVRDYSVCDLPDVGRADVVFAHVWLGDKKCMEKDFPMIADFVRFYSSFGAKKIFLTHLYESGRAEESCWRREHAEMIRKSFSETSPDVEVVIPAYGETVFLS